MDNENKINVDDMKSVINDSGLTIKEFGNLCDVSRVTVYDWFSGSEIKKNRYTRITGVMNALRSAIAAKDMPIERPAGRKVDHVVVMNKIKSIVIKHLKLLTETN